VSIFSKFYAWNILTVAKKMQKIFIAKISNYKTNIEDLAYCAVKIRRTLIGKFIKLYMPEKNKLIFLTDLKSMALLLGSKT